MDETVSYAHRLQWCQPLCACQVEEPAAAPEAAAGETEALKIREEASKKGREIEAAPEHSKDAEGRKQKEPKKASKDAKDAKDRRAPSKDKVRLGICPLMLPDTHSLSGVPRDSPPHHSPQAPRRLALAKQSSPMASP